MAKAEEFLKAVREDPEIREYIKDHALPEGMSDSEALTALAGQFGFDVTAEELSAAINARKAEISSAKASAEEAVNKLDLNDLDKVAGGKGDPRCKKVFEHYDNCWGTDRCDTIVEEY